MKVGILIHCLEQGGAQSMVLRIFDSFDAAGIDSYLITIDRNREIPLPFDRDRQAYLNRRVIQLSNSDVHWNTPRKVLIAPYQWIRLSGIVKKLGISIILSFMERANILNLLTPLPRRKIISVRKHASMALLAKSPLKRGLIIHLYPRLLRKAERINFNSREAAEDFRHLFHLKKERISVIYNYCDIEHLSALAKDDIPYKFQGIFNGPLVITSGRLIHAKGHLHLLRAFKEVLRNHPNVKLVILGDGPLEGSLRLLAKQLHIDDRVLMPGFQANPFSWIARADVFVLPSLAEGFPNALMEAMALGLPVISTDCPSGPREMLAPETDPKNKTQHLEYAPYGLLIPPLDGKMYGADEPLSSQELLLSESIDIMLRDNELRHRYSKAARLRAGEFSPEKIIPQWLELIGAAP